MKKLVLILSLTCIAFFANAQRKYVKGYLCANGGANFATFFQSSTDVSSLTGVWGPEAGLSFRYVTPTWVGFEGGFNYSVKGAAFSDSINTKAYVNYAGAFFDGLIYFPLKNNDDMYAGAGFYGGYGISGKVKSDSANVDMKFGDTWKRGDVGFEFRVGYVVKNTVGLGIRYSIGFVPVYSGTDLRGRSNHGRNSVFNMFITFQLAKIYNKYWTK